MNVYRTSPRKIYEKSFLVVGLYCSIFRIIFKAWDFNHPRLVYSLHSRNVHPDGKTSLLVEAVLLCQGVPPPFLLHGSNQ